jgi:hypothetical protein
MTLQAILRRRLRAGSKTLVRIISYVKIGVNTCRRFVDPMVYPLLGWGTHIVCGVKYVESFVVEVLMYLGLAWKCVLIIVILAASASYSQH